MHSSAQHEVTFSEAASIYISAGGEPRYLEPLIKFFGHRPLQAINQYDIDFAALAILPNAAASTRNRQVHGPISAVLKFGAARELCKHFRISRPRVSKQVVQLPSQRDLDAFGRAAGPSLKQITRFKLETDATEHELLTLDWCQVNTSRKQALLRRADGSTRVVLLSGALVEMLARSSKNQVGRVFRTDSGQPYKVHGNYGGRIKTAFAGASKRSGVKITFLMLHRIWCARRSDASRDGGSIPGG
ncbi:MAG: hypothetical protein QOI05_356 [Bradyrhizobium sp.]|jgi:hypothetical protein|nr:hypothetical protein [Bradyrhizobium sp.]